MEQSSPSLEPAQSPSRSLSLFTLTWPIFIELMLHMLMGNVNTMMLGKYSDDAVAAVGVSTQVIGILIVIFGFVASGTSILVAQHLGAKQYTEARSAAITAIALNLLFGIAMSLLLIISAETWLGWMQLPAHLYDYAMIYTSIVGLFLFVEALKLTMSAVARAHGHTKSVMYVTVAMNVANVFGCWLVLYEPFGLPSFGVAGVAVSVVVSRTLGLIGVIFILVNKVNIRVRLREWFQLQSTYVRNLLRIGVPSAGEHLAYQSSQLMITFFVTLIGTMALTTKIYVTNLSFFLFLFSAAIGMGTQIIVGHMVGAGRFEDAYRRCLTSVLIALAVSIGVSLLFAGLAPQLFRLFTNNGDIIQLASGIMLLVVLLEPGRCLNLVIINSLKAAGDIRFPVIMGVISMWGLTVPLAWLFGVHWGYGLYGVFVAIIIDEWFRGLIMLWRWRTRKWQSMRFVQT